MPISTCSTRPWPTRGGCRRWWTTTDWTPSSADVVAGFYTHPLNNRYTGNIGDDNHATIRLRRVWDTWSTDYSRAAATGIDPTTGFPVGPTGIRRRLRSIRRIRPLPGAVAGHPDPDPGRRPGRPAHQGPDDPPGLHGQVVSRARDCLPALMEYGSCVGWVKPTSFSIDEFGGFHPPYRSGTRQGRFDHVRQFTTQAARATGRRPDPDPRHAGAARDHRRHLRDLLRAEPGRARSSPSPSSGRRRPT